MPIYIVCRKKRNNPRMDVRICEMKCNMKDDCGEFKSQAAACHPATEPQGSETVGLKAA